MSRYLALGLCILVACLTPIGPAQFPGTVEGELFVADRGNQPGGGDGQVRRYSHTGTLRQILPGLGSGQIRGITTDDAGRVYVARGSQVRRYTAGNYMVDGVFTVNGVRAQDVAYNPTTGTLWCAFGQNAAEAMLVEVNVTTGAVIRMLTNTALVHPRSIAIDYAGLFLFVANGTGGNVIRVNLTTTTAVFQTLITLTTGMITFNAIGITVDAAGQIFVVSDFGAAQTIVRVTGTPGMATPSLYLAYASIPGMRAPAGCVADTYGNIYFACRNDNMSTDGVYGFSTSTMFPVVAPYTGMEHVNPIDVAFLAEPFSIAISSPDGVNAFNVPIARTASSQPTVTISISAPRFPGRAYGILMSLFPGLACSTGQPTVPIPGQGLILAIGEPRRIPLVADFLFLQSLNAVQMGGTVPFFVPPFDPMGNPVCPGSIPGTLIFFSGVTDMLGNANAFFHLPTLPCLPVGAQLRVAVAGSVTDGGQTAPLGIGVMSNIATCLIIAH